MHGRSHHHNPQDPASAQVHGGEWPKLDSDGTPTPPQPGSPYHRVIEENRTAQHINPRLLDSAIHFLQDIRFP